MLPPQSYEPLGSPGDLNSGSSKPQGAGISVANYVQNINVFVTDSSQNLHGTGPGGFGYGLGHGIAGGLGSAIGAGVGSEIGSVKDGGGAAAFLPIDRMKISNIGHPRHLQAQHHQPHKK